MKDLIRKYGGPFSGMVAHLIQRVTGLLLLFYLGQDVANNPNRPKWNPESYNKIVEKKPSA